MNLIGVTSFSYSLVLVLELIQGSLWSESALTVIGA